MAKLNTHIEYCIHETEVVKKLISILKTKEHIGSFPIKDEKHNSLFCGFGRDFAINNTGRETEIYWYYRSGNDWKAAYDKYDCIVLFEVIEKPAEEYTYNSFDDEGKKVNVDISLRIEDLSVYGYSSGKDIVIITLLVGKDEYLMSRFVSVVPDIFDEHDLMTKVGDQFFLLPNDMITEKLQHRFFNS